MIIYRKGMKNDDPFQYSDVSIVGVMLSAKQTLEGDNFFFLKKPGNIFSPQEKLECVGDDVSPKCSFYLYIGKSFEVFLIIL